MSSSPAPSDRHAHVAATTNMATLTPRELGAAVTPLFEIPGRLQQQALNELVIRCEVADRLLRERDGEPS